MGKELVILAIMLSAYAFKYRECYAVYYKDKKLMIAYINT